MHEATARGLCRLAFVFLGVLPLLCCLYLAARPHIPGFGRAQAERWARALSAQLGVDVSVLAVQSHTPNRFSLHEIQLSHPETGEAIGRLPQVEVQQSGYQWSLAIPQVELEGQQLRTAWKMFHDWFLCRPEGNSGAIRISMEEFSIRGPLGRSPLTGLRIAVLPTRESTLVNITFEPGNTPQTATQPGLQSTRSMEGHQPSQLIIKRRHSAEKLGTDLQLRTGTTPLPCPLLANLHGELSRLGDDATFGGIVNVQLYEKTWRASVHDAWFQAVDFGRLASGTSASLSGSGILSVEKLVVVPQGLQEFFGGGEVRLGRMDQRMFQSLGRYLDFQLRESNPVSSYGFERLEFGVSLGGPRLQLWGKMLDQQGLLAQRINWEQPLELSRLQEALMAWSAGNGSVTNVARLSTETPVQ